MSRELDGDFNSEELIPVKKPEKDKISDLKVVNDISNFDDRCSLFDQLDLQTEKKPSPLDETVKMVQQNLSLQRKIQKLNTSEENSVNILHMGKPRVKNEEEKRIKKEIKTEHLHNRALEIQNEIQN